MLEIGCGNGHDLLGFARQGVLAIGIDIAKEQLREALGQSSVAYVVAAGEVIPLKSGSIDLVVSDHGAFDDSPPSALLPEIRRVLRPGGLLAICTYSPLAHACYDSETRRIVNRLVNDYPADRVVFDGDASAAQMSYAGWVRAFRQGGFSIERLEELRPGKESRNYFDELVTTEWAARWPSDLLWIVRREG